MSTSNNESGVTGDVDAIPADICEDLEQISAERRWRKLQYDCREDQAYLKTVREKVAQYPNFWSTAMLNHRSMEGFASLSEDQKLLGYITNIELKQEVQDPRPFELVFHFAENPFFSDKTLSKRYTLVEGEPAPADGKVTPAMADFDMTHLRTHPETINWKSDDVNLCKKHPRSAAKEEPQGDDEDFDEDFDGDFGSFFHWFTSKTDDFGVGDLFMSEILPEIIDLYLQIDQYDEDDELDEEGGSDEDEIELNSDDDEEADRPPKKKPKV